MKQNYRPHTGNSSFKSLTTVFSILPTVGLAQPRKTYYLDRYNVKKGTFEKSAVTPNVTTFDKNMIKIN